MLRWSWLLLCLAATSAAAESSCNPDSVATKRCLCDVTALRPLQGALGRAEVQEKLLKIKKNPDKRRRSLSADQVRIVVGPDQQFYITDHHHVAEAWREFGERQIYCQIDSTRQVVFGSRDEFWARLKDNKSIWLKDAEGRAIAPDQLPMTLEAMPDDPYRSLAHWVEKVGGFCRPKNEKEFFEFRWADWLRVHMPGLRSGGDISSEQIERAKALSQSVDAKDIPGSVGAAPSVACDDDD